MTTYYVKPTGDNTKDGLSSANAWETITYALTQMIANDELIIAAGAYAEDVAIATEHITLTGAGSGSVTVNTLQLNASYYNVSGLTATTSTSISDNPAVTNGTLDDVIGEDMVLLTGATNATINNCDFTGLFLTVNANAAAFTNCICRPHVSGQYTINIAGAGVTNTTFENTTILGDPGTYKAIRILNGTNTVFTNTTFEYPEKAIEVDNGATATFIQNNRKILVGTTGTNTVTATESTLVVADGTYDYRDFVITPDASIVIAETSLWETSGEQNKAWKVTATGSRTITFRLTDMQTSTRYHLLVDDVKVATELSDSSGVIEFDYTGSFSEKAFTTAVAIPTHDLIRTAAITTLQTDATLNGAIKTWLRYLLDTGKITYPAIYIGTIAQPLDGSCGTDTQQTSIADPMKITVGVLSNTHAAAATELGTLYELVYAKFKAVPELGLSNFKIHHISPIITKPIPKCGRSIIRAEMTLNATLEE